MKKVIDKNLFQDPDLEVYLKENNKNFIVFTDYAWMEAYKGDAIKNIQHSFEILSRYPMQVLLLKCTREIIKEQHATGITTNVELEDVGATEEFKKFCENLPLVGKGNEKIDSQVLLHGKAAQENLDAIERNAPVLVKGIMGISKLLSEEHINALRKGTTISEESIKAMMLHICLLTRRFMETHPDVSAWPTGSKELKNSYIFRYATAGYLLALRWISVGGPGNVNTERLRNDVVDLNYAVCASYFDGLLSKDEKALGIYKELCFLLNELFIDLKEHT